MRALPEGVLAKLPHLHPLLFDILLPLIGVYINNCNVQLHLQNQIVLERWLDAVGEEAPGKLPLAVLHWPPAATRSDQRTVVQYKQGVTELSLSSLSPGILHAARIALAGIGGSASGVQPDSASAAGAGGSAACGAGGSADSGAGCSSEDASELTGDEGDVAAQLDDAEEEELSEEGGQPAATDAQQEQQCSQLPGTLADALQPSPADGDKALAQELRQLLAGYTAGGSALRWANVDAPPVLTLDHSSSFTAIALRDMCNMSQGASLEFLGAGTVFVKPQPSECSNCGVSRSEKRLFLYRGCTGLAYCFERQCLLPVAHRYLALEKAAGRVPPDLLNCSVCGGEGMPGVISLHGPTGKKYCQEGARCYKALVEERQTAAEEAGEELDGLRTCAACGARRLPGLVSEYGPTGEYYCQSNMQCLIAVQQRELAEAKAAGQTLDGLRTCIMCGTEGQPSSIAQHGPSVKYYCAAKSCYRKLLIKLDQHAKKEGRPVEQRKCSFCGEMQDKLVTKNKTTGLLVCKKRKCLRDAKAAQQQGQTSMTQFLKK